LQFLQRSRLTTRKGIWLDSYHPGRYVLLFSNGKAYADLPEYCRDDFEKVAGAIPDLRPAAVTTSVPSRHSRGSGYKRAGRLLGKILVKVAILVATNLIAGNNGGRQTFSSSGTFGGGGQTFVSPPAGGGLDTSGFWDPINSAASDPIQ
jgi:hypothetical protein